MRPRPRRPSPAFRALLRRQREAERTREAARAREALEAARREVAAVRLAAERLTWGRRYDALVDQGLAFDTAGGRPPGWRDAAPR